MRLRCHAHNQYEAERVFGAELMSRKRHEAPRVMDEGRVRAACNMPRGMLEVTDGTRATAEKRAAPAEAAREEAALEQLQDVLAGLRHLGCRAHEARRAAAFTATLQGVTLEERMWVALTHLGRR
jgi:hypothetical protein